MKPTRTAAGALSGVVLLILASCGPKQPVSIGPDQPPMIRIPGGTYVIGSDAGRENERPVHTVIVQPFYIDKYEVTNRMYLAFVRDTGHPMPKRWLPDSTIIGREDLLPFDQGEANLPVTWVTWYDAMAYAEWRGCRLPTEAEWEIAARCSTAYVFPWGNDTLTTADEVGNMEGSEDGFSMSPAPVGSFTKGRSCWGAEDMAGNVWEWVQDWYLPAAYQNLPRTGPMTVATDSLYGQRVIRGGSWFDPVDNARTTMREGFDPSYGSDILGFRCARDAGHVASRSSQDRP